VLLTDVISEAWQYTGSRLAHWRPGLASSTHRTRRRQMRLWDQVKRGYLELIAPVVEWMVVRRVSPNTITTLGTMCCVLAGAVYASGHIRAAGLVLGFTALFDVADGEVARKSGRESVFGAFYDSTLDRVADGAILGGLCVFFARAHVHHGIPAWMSTPMVVVLLLGIIGAFLTSYTRARAESLGIDARVGMLQRPGRIVLLSAPQAFFGLTLGGWVLMAICFTLSLTAWITAVQRIAFVHRATDGRQPPRSAEVAGAQESGAPGAWPAATESTRPGVSSMRLPARLAGAAAFKSLR
jgi:CDP-diacylglycerol--glycerol-3-phosphate 3-phosphatidyltransferase